MNHSLWLRLTITTRLFARPGTISQTSSWRSSFQDVTDVTLKSHSAVHGCRGDDRIKFSIAETRYCWARNPCERITFFKYFYDIEDSKCANVWSNSQPVSQSVSQPVSLLRRHSLGSSRNLPPPRTSAETTGHIPYPLFKKISRRARGDHRGANRRLVIVQ